MAMSYLQVPRQTRAGTAATEFAITIPLLMLMALGAMDFGRVSYCAEVVSNAARTGAERGSIERFTNFTRPAWEDRVREAVVEEMQNMPEFDEGLLNYTLVVTSDPDGISHRIVVEVAYPFRTVIFWPMLPPEIQLRERIQFRQFR